MKNLTILLFLLLGTSLFAQKITPTEDGGQIILETFESAKSNSLDIKLTKKNKSGKIEWTKDYGGTSYDKGGDVISTQDNGYIIVGSTSSFGNGNYNVWLVKTDENGKEEWSKAYGGFYNEYGYTISQSEDGGYLINGKKQICEKHNAWGNCYYEAWLIKTDNNGREVWNKPITNRAE